MISFALNCSASQHIRDIYGQVAIHFWMAYAIITIQKISAISPRMLILDLHFPSRPVCIHHEYSLDQYTEMSMMIYFTSKSLT